MTGGLSLFLFKEGSRNQLNNHRTDGNFSRYYNHMFAMELPHQDTVHDVLCVLLNEYLEQIKMNLMSNLFEQKWLRGYRLLDEYYLATGNATGIVSFDKQDCERKAFIRVILSIFLCGLFYSLSRNRVGRGKYCCLLSACFLSVVFFFSLKRCKNLLRNRISISLSYANIFKKFYFPSPNVNLAPTDSYFPLTKETKMPASPIKLPIPYPISV